MNRSFRLNFMRSSISEHAVVWACFSLLLLCYHLIFKDFFPNKHGLLGHDFMLASPALLDGYIWFHKNGLFEVPWFTPSFCGGQPLFADPQSGYYSVLQFLTFVVDPLTASYVSLLLFAAIGFWGFYFLLRLLFQASWQASTLAGALYMFHGFLSHRSIIGELGYLGITLAPWIALLLLHPAPLRFGILRRGGNTILAGILMAYWLHSGLTTLMIPAGLSIFALACVYGLQGNSIKPFLFRSAGATALALALCASKLTAGVSFAKFFPRSGYLFPGAESIGQAAKLIFQGMFLSSETASESAGPVLRNVQWAVLPHEWAYGVTMIPLIFMAIALGVWLRGIERKSVKKMMQFLSPYSVILSLSLFAVLLLPLALNTYSPKWNAFLTSLPLLKSTSWPFRWIIIYVPLIVLVSALLFDRQRIWVRHRKWFLALSLIGVVTLNAIEKRDYYQAQEYDPKPVTDAYWRLKAGQWTPHIIAVGMKLDQNGGAISKDNNLFIYGVSQMMCYNPIFGYSLEFFPLRDLTFGHALTEVNGHLNFKNPSCYVFSRENQCAPGDHFRLDQIEQASQFVNYKPFRFFKSTAQLIADFLTKSVLVVLLILLLAAPFKRFGVFVKSVR